MPGKQRKHLRVSKKGKTFTAGKAFALAALGGAGVLIGGASVAGFAGYRVVGSALRRAEKRIIARRVSRARLVGRMRK